MPATPGRRLSCEGASKSKSWKWVIVANIVLLQMVIPVGADALVDGTVDNAIRDPELRSLRLSVVTQSPPDCLVLRSERENHCWYVLKGPGKLVGGTYLTSNNSGYTGFANLAMAAILASNSSPVNVGVGAFGRTIWLFNLPGGTSVGVDLSIPEFAKTGGYDYLSGKRLDFPIFLNTRATVPHAGTVRAQGHKNATAFVDMKYGTSELVAVVRAEGTAGSLSSSIIFFASIRPYDATFEHWRYSAYISFNISGNPFEICGIFRPFSVDSSMDHGQSAAVLPNQIAFDLELESTNIFYHVINDLVASTTDYHIADAIQQRWLGCERVMRLSWLIGISVDRSYSGTIN
ncbi:hypothetical protein FOZ63_013825 [Perkinsus olseni]|uniref:Uncharacterized protein n=2 Tax=Perkinsus olseni TaxID=32597 RepID=A0A7J6SKG8_PEROL|nr:hypothetical protein FOZ63_013825 [Perkinsus olseni]